MKPPGNRKLILLLLSGTCGMFAFGFLLVPLYDVFCNITGLNGKTAGPYVMQSQVPVDAEREVTVQFLTSNNAGMPWRFAAQTHELRVTPGEVRQVAFEVFNPTGQPMVAQAVPSVSPSRAATHLRKIQCFCFEHQQLDPGMSQLMPLQFMVSPDLPRDIRKLTLSYTLFDITDPVAGRRSFKDGRQHDG